MLETIEADICIIGAGSAGLSVAAGAAQMGARTVLIEAHRMGGDCLNTGCVPSKSLLAAAKAAQTVRGSTRFGINGVEAHVDFGAANRHVHDVIGAIAPHDSVERFMGLGCKVIEARGHFIDRHTVLAGSYKIRARRFVIATGSRPFVPPIQGLEAVPYFTNETIFENAVLPEHLIIIGAGPVGCEMAQAHRRLGAKVTVLDLARMLPKDDTEAVDVVRQQFITEGIETAEAVRIERVEKTESGVAVLLNGADARRIEGSHLLVATGRQANVRHLGLEQAGVRHTPKGIEVDARLRTSNKRIFAAGDVIGSYQFTHVASYHAGIVLRNALFRLPVRNAPKALPWVTYTDPELAQVGLNEADARKLHGDGVRVVRAEFAGNDRAQAEATTHGFLKAVVGRGGRILGATIVGPHAGELILPWVLAISKGHKIGDMAGVIAPYPTLSEISKRAAGSYFTPILFSARTRWLVRFLGAFG
ncbi:MAG: FAD-dependent oxidoreductase [Hyphomicrobium sp.]|uniref:dihydrolipoyl dehydrogenase family protein n=1 Tax=Hyphomicrobium sp. TaxID=82 RepID=UPI00132C416E|nr:FAD-dependent oxidoreductase [Hyphomicrobium sp.]KAB2943122.1 MAG: dihydrolipoamide dehydrogenase [Hyphomicrobium sp.]MBZ0209010.1 FAD-dependent oxidoreductase [Hyphomicrobium sp.]